MSGNAPSWWTGRRFHLDTNKEVFGAKVHATYHALSIMDQRQENSQQYTSFVDPTAAVGSIRTDSIGPGQRFAMAAIEACTRLLERGSVVAIRWVPAHRGVPGDGGVGGYAKLRPTEEGSTVGS